MRWAIRTDVAQRDAMIAGGGSRPGSISARMTTMNSWPYFCSRNSSVSRKRLARARNYFFFFPFASFRAFARF
jgi:hypothetical protein